MSGINIAIATGLFRFPLYPFFTRRTPGGSQHEMNSFLQKGSFPRN